MAEKNLNVFQPRYFSVGPIHRNITIPYWQDIKDRCIRNFRDRVEVNSIDKFWECLSSKEEIIKNSYDLDIGMSFKELIDLILNDPIFLVEVMLLSWENDDGFLPNSKLKSQLLRDLFLLENQIPHFVVRDLCELYLKHQSKKNNYIYKFCDTYKLLGKLVEMEVDEGNIPKRSHHLLDVRRKMEIGGWE